MQTPVQYYPSHVPGIIVVPGGPGFQAGAVLQPQWPALVWPLQLPQRHPYFLTGVSQAPLQLRPSERQTPGQNDLCGSERSSSDAAVLDMQSGSAARGIGSANGLASPARGSSSVDETSSFLQAAESLSLSDGFTKSPSRRTRNKGRRHSTSQAKVASSWKSQPPCRQPSGDAAPGGIKAASFPASCKLTRRPSSNGSATDRATRPVPKMPRAPDASDDESGSPAERPKSLQPCTYFLKTGECSFGNWCRFQHPEHLRPKFTLQGFPIRPGAPDCPFHCKYKWCGFAKACKFNHVEQQPAESSTAGSTSSPDSASVTLDLEESGGSGSTDFTEAATATAASHSSAEDQPAADSALDPDSGVAELSPTPAGLPESA